MASRYEGLLLVVLLIIVVGPSLAHAQDRTDPVADEVKGLPVDAQGTTVLSSPEAQDPAGTTGTPSPGQSVTPPPAEPTGTTGTTSPSESTTSPTQTGTSPIANTTFPKPQHTGLSTLFRDTVLDYATFPRRESTWFILGIGGGLAALAHPLDDDLNQHLVSSGAADKIWKPGHIIGGPVMYVLPPVIYLGGRYILPKFTDDVSTTNKWSHMGLDLVRAELLQEGLVEGIKVSVNRTRPNGQKYSFPSGHAAATFAFASVIERHLGARLALPTILIATYVATSRLHDNVHFLSDVVFGAAVGTAAGWTVVGRHGRTNYTMAPTPVPGGMAFMVTRTPRSAN
jgi:hypothetical protein